MWLSDFLQCKQKATYVKDKYMFAYNYDVCQ